MPFKPPLKNQCLMPIQSKVGCAPWHLVKIRVHLWAKRPKTYPIIASLQTPLSYTTSQLAPHSIPCSQKFLSLDQSISYLVHSLFSHELVCPQTLLPILVLFMYFHAYTSPIPVLFLYIRVGISILSYFPAQTIAESRMSLFSFTRVLIAQVTLPPTPYFVFTLNYIRTSMMNIHPGY